MDRSIPDPLAPIFLESHDLPPIAGGYRVRRRGIGYTSVDQPAGSAATPVGNREHRRRAARIARTSGRSTLAALLIGPVALLLAGPAAAAVDDATTTTTVPATSTTDAPVTTATTPETTAATTIAPTTRPTTTPSTAVRPATTPAPPTATSTTTTTAAGPTTPSSTASSPPRGGTTTVPGSVVPSTTPDSTTTTSTVPGASVPLPVGDAELPPETPLDADPVAAAGSGALVLHRDLLAATRTLTQLTDDRAAGDAEVARLEARTAELTNLAFDLAGAERATGDVELLRVAAQADLDTARTAAAALALRQAMATTELSELSDRYPTARLQLATLVTARTGGEARRLDAAWSRAGDDRLTVVYAALAQVGDPYVWAASGPDTFDCSGLTAFAWKAAGITLEHYTVTQRQTTLDVAEADLLAGDLVFNLDGPNGGHVMLYLGLDRLVVHAPAPNTFVSVSSYRTTTGFGSPLAAVDGVGESIALGAG